MYVRGPIHYKVSYDEKVYLYNFGEGGGKAHQRNMRHAMSMVVGCYIVDGRFYGEQQVVEIHLLYK